MLHLSALHLVYVQQFSSYPMINDLVTGLQPFVLTSWPSNNYDYNTGLGPPKYIGPRGGIYACPAYNRLRLEFQAEPKDFPYGNSGSYGYNAVGNLGKGLGTYNIPNSARFIPPARESQVLAPSDMIGMAEATLLEPFGEGQPIDGNTEYWDLFEDPKFLQAVLYGVPMSYWAFPSAVRAMKQRHSGRWNVGFCDSHVESLTPMSLFNVSNSVVAQRWNIDHQPHN